SLAVTVVSGVGFFGAFFLVVRDTGLLVAGATMALAASTLVLGWATTHLAGFTRWLGVIEQFKDKRRRYDGAIEATRAVRKINAELFVQQFQLRDVRPEAADIIRLSQYAD